MLREKDTLFTVSDGTKLFKAADPECIHNVTKCIHVGCLVAQQSIQDLFPDSVFPKAHHKYTIFIWCLQLLDSGHHSKR